MKIKAFLYDSEYYELPTEFESAREFHDAYAGKAPVTVKWLREKKCMAPYFVAENVKKKKITVRADKPAFDCEAEIMSLDEYNERLMALIPAHCADCGGFTPRGENESLKSFLSGHHEEITLDDVCFLKHSHNDYEYDFPPFDVFVKRAVNKFKRLGLEKLIDENNTEKAVKKYLKLIWGECGFPHFPVWLDKTDSGKYRLVSTTYSADADAILYEELTDALNEQYGDTWEFYNYIPQGYFTPDADDDFKLYYKADEKNGMYVIINVEINIDSDEQFPFDRNMNYLYGKCGENKYRAAVSQVMINAFEAPGFTDTDHGFVEITPDDFAAVTDKLCKGKKKDELKNPPVCEKMELLSKDERQEPTEVYLKDHLLLCSFRSVDLTGVLAWRVMDGLKPLDIRDKFTDYRCYVIANCNIPCARLSLDLGGVPSGTLFDYPELLGVAQNNIQCLNDALKKSKSAKPFFQCFDSKLKKLDVWLVVLHYPTFMYSIRRLAPLFNKYHGFVEIYTASGESGGRYELGFKMKKLKDEPEMLSELKDDEE